MLKKMSIILSIFFCILFITTFSFATTSNDVKNTISNGTDSVVNAVDNIGSDVRGGIGAVENGIEGAVKDVGNDFTNDDSMSTDAGYTATRTSSDMTTNNNGLANSTLWTWLILAVIGIVIIALVWYYATQTNNNHDNL